MAQKAKMVAMVLIILVTFTGCCFFSGTCKQDPPNGTTSENDAMMTIYKQRSKAINTVRVARGTLYDNKKKITKVGSALQKEYNNTLGESEAFVNFVILKLTADEMNTTDFSPYAVKYVNAVDNLNGLVYPKPPVEKIFGADDLIAGIIEGLAKAGVEVWKGVHETNEADRIKKVGLISTQLKGAILPNWDELMKEINK